MWKKKVKMMKNGELWHVEGWLKWSERYLATEVREKMKKDGCLEN